MGRLTLVSMSGLRVGCDAVLEAGMQLPGLKQRADALSQLPPLGLLTIAGTVPDNWHMDLVSDSGTEPLESTVDAILSAEPDVVAFSALTPSADRAAAISQQLRERGVTTIVGGLHATAIPEWCEPRFDVVAVGDGERLMPQVLADWEQDRLQKRYRDDGRFDISESPIPRWDLLKDRPPRFTLQTERGCPWACNFCGASRLLGAARQKSDRRIAEELHAITAQQKRPWLELADDNTFAFDRNYAPVLESLRQSGARWFTESDWRIARKPELLRSIARAGCRQILVGVESTVFRYPGMGKKAAELAEITEAIRVMQDHGIAVNACFIVGAEGETRASIERLKEFLLASEFSELQLTLQTPFPGTSLYKSLLRDGRLLYEDFSRYTLFDVVYQPSHLRPQELQQEFIGLIKSVFSQEQQNKRVHIRRKLRRIAKHGCDRDR